ACLGGDGNRGAAVARRAKALGIASSVVFGGHRSDVPPLLGALDVFCISSTYEGTPLALFEAMAAGKTIVSTAVDRCREVLEDGVTALLVPPADAEARAVTILPRAPDPPLPPSHSRPQRTPWLRQRRVRREDAGPLRRAPRREAPMLRSPREAWEVPRDALLRRYPPFVTGGALERGEVPVFVFHSLEPVSFGRKLA